jgi:NAD+ synthase (glutamine-hydrolysing)
MQDESLHGILLSIGMPIMHRNNRFNCQAILMDGKILMLRAKLWLANDGNCSYHYLAISIRNYLNSE